MAIELTIGMSSYDDFIGTYFTVQSLRLYQDMTGVEILIVDNYGDEQLKTFITGWVPEARYILFNEVVGTSPSRNKVFEEARGQNVLCLDCHVLLVPGAVVKLKQFYRDNPECRDLLQGPLVYDDLKNVSTHFDPVWRSQMLGTWGYDEREKLGEPFEIPAQGFGLFSCRKDAFLWFPKLASGFGGEEAVTHQKYKKAGRKTLCLPWLRWVHFFGRKTVPYPLLMSDKIRNYMFGHIEIGESLQPIYDHFKEFVNEDFIREQENYCREKIRSANVL